MTSFTLTENIALAAMTVWEAFLEESFEQKGLYRANREKHGTSEFRELILTKIAPIVEDAYLCVKEDLHHCFDWEFVPCFLSVIEEPFFTGDQSLTQEQIKQLAKKVIAELDAK